MTDRTNPANSDKGIPWRKGLGRLCGLLFGLLACMIVGAFAVLPLYDLIEEHLGIPIVPEYAIRVYSLSVLGLFLLGWLAVVLWDGHLAGMVTWMMVAAGSLAIAVVCVLDRNHPLQSEGCWIRYTTAAFLLAGAALSVAVALSRFQASSELGTRWIWWFPVVILVSAVADELFQGHERVGAFIEQRFQLDHIFTDFITMVYAVAAIVFALILFIKLKGHLPRHRAFRKSIMAAAVCFLISQLFDTLDVFVFRKLVQWGYEKSAGGVFVIPDVWYFLWSPERLFNSVEEILENLAAVLLCTSILLVLIDVRKPAARTIRFGKPKWAVALGFAIVLISAVTVLWVGLGYRPATSPIDGQAVAVVSAADGLFHADDAAFHPRWGLLVANEGMGGLPDDRRSRLGNAVPDHAAQGRIVRYQDGRITELPDPKRVLVDVDSVSATGDAVFASSASLRTVFRYMENTGWERFLTEDDGLQSPEGLTIVDSTMYILDETHHLVYVCDMFTKELRTMPLNDKRWHRPEGIVYHPQLRELLITDDTTGFIIGLAPGKPPRVFASRADGLRGPEAITVDQEGHVLVADAAHKEVIVFSSSGQVVRRIELSRNHGYVVGIALGGQDREKLYVVQSDGYSSESWVPCTVWMFSNYRAQLSREK